MADKKDKALYGLTILKYIVAIGLTIFAYTNIKSELYFVMAVMELFLIAVVSDLLMKVNKIAAIIVNSILILMYNAQMLVLYFGSSYITLIMLSNLESAEDLSGKAFEYILVILFLQCIPILIWQSKKLKGFSRTEPMPRSLMTELLYFIVIQLWMVPGNRTSFLIRQM